MRPRTQRTLPDQSKSLFQQGGKVLKLFVEPGNGAQKLDGEWRVTFAIASGGNPTNYADESLDDSGWEAVQLPHLAKGTASRDTLWYRCRFQVEQIPEGKHLLLRFGGAFYHTHIWLNGFFLGEHEGYFQPFGFDITELARTGENLLVVSCRFPIEAGAFKRKTAVAGIFADWDCKPYPSVFFPDLPEPYEWEVPVGLWAPVQLVTSGPVLIESLNVFPSLHGIDWSPPIPRAEVAGVRLVLTLRNLSIETQTFPLKATLTPKNFDEPVSETSSQTIELIGGETCQLEWQMGLSQPRLWFPWTHGEPWLYRVQLELGEMDPDKVEKAFGVREIRTVIEEGRWEWWLNERRIFPKGSNYLSDFFLDRATPASLRGDIELARQANLDLLRVHAHIEAQAFYELCDEMGMLVFCDFPLIWTYAYNLPQGEKDEFKAGVLDQAEDMVRLLGSHPSIVLWSIHNEPPWSPTGEFLGNDVHVAETNRSLDTRAADRIAELDSTRPAIRASGEFDQHLYHGWYTGSWLDNRILLPPFPTEFGVQALPGRESPVWERLSRQWPVDPEEPSWAHAGYQSVFWASPGIGLPSQFASLEEYISESQAYQAFYIRFVIDQWRKRKFSPVGGYIHHLFVDSWPGITWSVLDYARLPKEGYHALAAASRPVHLALDPSEGFTIEKGYHLIYSEGAVFRIGMFLVNDDYRKEGLVSVRWWLERKDGGRIRKFFRRQIPGQAFEVELPGADQGALDLQQVEIPLSQPGKYLFRTEVKQDGEILDENQVEFRVGDRARRQRLKRRIPRFLVNKVYRPGSLRNTGDGFSFQLHNPAMTVTVQRIRDLRVDQSPVDPSQAEIHSGKQARKIATVSPQAPFEFTSKADLTTFVRGQPLPPGEHSFEVTVEVEGFGTITAEIRDSVRKP